MSKRKKRKETPEGLVKRMIKDGVDCSQRYANGIVDELMERYDMVASESQDIIDRVLDESEEKLDLQKKREAYKK
ncbi:MAG: hypothetical protein WC976_06790 [Caldisericia bacterium]